jgi:V8-like Glu-specific endopeptidase
MLRLEQQLSASYIVCHKDFEYLSGATPAQVFNALAEDFARAFSMPITATEISDALNFTDYICQLLVENPNQRVVLLIEELGALPRPSRFALANALRAIFQDRQRPTRRMLTRLMVIITGNTELYDLAYTEVSPFANICETHYLVDLGETEAISLIQDGLSMLNVPLDQSALLGASTYRLVHGYPYLTQRLGHALEIAFENGEQLSEDVLERTSEELITCGDPVLSHLHKVLIEQDLLSAAQSVLNEKIRFSRLEEALARLELAGFIRPDNKFWRVRNSLYAQAVKYWLEDLGGPEHDPLRPGIVRLFSKRGAPVGAGFLVDGNRVMTCGHVVTAALGRTQIVDGNEVIHLDFPLLAPGEIITARVSKMQDFQPGDVKDIAILQINTDVPTGAKPLHLSMNHNGWNQSIRVLGFPQDREDGTWATGELREQVAGGRVQLESIKTTGYPIVPGFSGSPVWCETTKNIVGMIVAADTDMEFKAAFMIPAYLLREYLSS